MGMIPRPLVVVGGASGGADGATASTMGARSGSMTRDCQDTMATSGSYPKRPTNRKHLTTTLPRRTHRPTSG